MKYTSLIAAGLLLMGQQAFAQSWTPPIGIPAPSFGIAEPNPNTATKCPGWPSTAVTGCYYVDRTASGATDSSNPNGTPSRPRATFPVTLSAGDYVEVHGSGYSTPSTQQGWTMNGAAGNPVIVHGVGGPTFSAGSTAEHYLRGTYWIIDGIHWVNTRIRRGNNTDSIYTSIRNCEISGWNQGAGTPMLAFGAPVTNHHDNVTYNCDIHDNGSLSDTADPDNHGVSVPARNYNYWLLDSRLYRNAGDGIQINAGSAANQSTTHHIYVGRNTAYSNRQNGFWTKQAEDVIFSENLSYSHRPSSSSPGAGLGFQYAPQRVWFLFNHVHDCDYGIIVASDNGLGTGTDSYYIGNVLHNIHHSSTSYNPDTSAAPAGIALRGGTNRYVINNTIYDADAGINVGASNGFVRMVNNIISNITDTRANHVFVEQPAVSGAAGTVLQNDLLDGSVRIKWGDGSMYTVSSFKSSFGSKGNGSINADPQLSAPTQHNFSILSTSPAIDAGQTDPAYQTFQTAYGISIAKDNAGKVRPAGAAYDIGAFEGSSGAPRAPSNLRIIK